MAPIPNELNARLVAVLEELHTAVKVRSAYLFGSQVSGKTHRYSDVDIAVFLDNFDAYSVQEELSLTSRICRRFGSDLEFHFFDASDPATEEPVSFAAEVKRTGLRIA